MTEFNFEIFKIQYFNMKFLPIWNARGKMFVYVNKSLNLNFGVETCDSDISIVVTMVSSWVWGRDKWLVLILTNITS